MVELTYTPELQGSRWIAANNPIHFKFTRRDAEIVSIDPYPGSVIYYFFCKTFKAFQKHGKFLPESCLRPYRLATF